jgi:hypothetical protein
MTAGVIPANSSVIPAKAGIQETNPDRHSTLKGAGRESRNPGDKPWSLKDGSPGQARG